MAFAPPSKVKISSTNLSKSTWTPLNNSDANKEVFEERRIIIKKWFEKWHDKQRRIVIEDIFKSLSEKHLQSVHMELQKKFPEERHDFTKRLPRVLSLYLFSFLDPRSLSRCAQVSWYWKYLTELDCLWKPKCLKFGWYPTYQPSIYEETVWKRHYITTIYHLHYVKVKPEQIFHKVIFESCLGSHDKVTEPFLWELEEKAKPNDEVDGLDTARTDNTRLSTARSQISTASAGRKKASVAPKNVPIPGPKWEPPPWKGSDPHPTDTVRYNYFDNKSAPKNKPRNHQRPKSAAGSVMFAAKKSDQSPVKSRSRPVSASSSRKAIVTQSLDPQPLRSTGSVNGDIPVANSRNMMSSSVSNFSYTGASKSQDTTNNHTLYASTYLHPVTPGLDTTADFSMPGLHGSPLKSMGTPTVSPNSKDASIRPKPVVSLSQTLTDKPKVATLEKFIEGQTPKIRKPIATVSDYKVKEPSASNGKTSPLKGSPWETQEVASDESDF